MSVGTGQFASHLYQPPLGRAQRSAVLLGLSGEFCFRPLERRKVGRLLIALTIEFGKANPHLFQVGYCRRKLGFERRKLVGSERKCPAALRKLLSNWLLRLDGRPQFTF